MADAELIHCPVCGATNRVLRSRIDQREVPVCGRCRTSLPIPGRPLTVTDATFSTMVEQSPVPVLLDMWAEWCQPCHMMAPLIDELAREMAGRVRIAKLNVDENPATASRFNVRSIPTLLALKAGREIDRIVGVQSKSDITRRLERLLAKA